MMRILVLLICCCASVSACTAAASSGRDVTVSTPSVGRPQPPASVQAALSGEAFTPYAALGQSNNDGLAPNESSEALSSTCMTAAGYPNANGPFAIRLGTANLAFGQPWGAWGYLGTAEAQQYGFRVPPGSALSALGIDAPAPGSSPATLPAAEQSALGKCGTIVGDFTNAAQDGALAGIDTLSNDLYNDVAKDAAVSSATQAWTACMARNGYSFHQPQAVFRQEIQDMFGGGTSGTTGPRGRLSWSARCIRRPADTLAALYRMAPLVNHKVIAALIPGARLYTVRGGGHLILLDGADQVGPVIASFLREG